MEVEADAEVKVMEMEIKMETTEVAEVEEEALTDGNVDDHVPSVYVTEDGPFAHYLTTGLSRFATTTDIVQHISGELEGLEIEVESIKNLRYRPRNIYLVADRSKNQPPAKFRTRHDMNVWIVKLTSPKFMEDGAPLEFSIENNSKTVYLNMVNNNHTRFLLDLADRKNLNESTVVLKRVPRHLSNKSLLRYAFKQYELIADPDLAITRIDVGFRGNDDDDRENEVSPFFDFNIRFKTPAEARQFVRENMKLCLDGYPVYVQAFRE
ncbi:hypothetical protein TrRE_jg4473 [Triparma retinervis]|uniref:Uncharacterized protein n=1 Tax=Triparma retinervis TaxID=2557542 RepID=A0A9W7E7A0_9STRA|nr:hypothetical protein TrRE_jg4473 [Triparma retinervis]